MQTLPSLRLPGSAWLLLACGMWHFALLAACTRQGPPPDPNIITVAARVGPNSLHPLKANDEGTTRVAALVYESLMEIGDDLRARPGLAERLENPDPLTFVAHLRRGVRFHDNRELTARDVVFTFGQFLDPAFISPYKGAFTVMSSVRALDDYTVEFKLKEPFASFPFANLVPIDIIPADIDEASLTRFPIGTGPYRFVRYEVDDRVELSAFEGYWDGLPNNAGVVIKIIPDDTMRGLELRKGSADVIMNDIVPDIAYQLERSGDFKTVRSPGLDFSYLGFNMRDPIVSDKRVRHAIGYAINREAITKYLRRDLARTATGLIPPQAWAYERDIFTFTYDPARAMQLLDEAGYRDPDGPQGPLPRLSLSLKISTNEDIRLQSTVIQEDLRRVGINLDLRTYEFATVFADILKGNFQIMSLQWIGGAVIDPDILRRVFHSTQIPPVGFNRGYYRNAEVDRLIDLATAALTEAEQKEYYGEAQKIIAEEAPYIPIWNRVNVLLARTNLDGLHMTATAHFATLQDVKRRATPNP
jgi:peptide/nickel transport system substrate-binding protein